MVKRLPCLVHQLVLFHVLAAATALQDAAAGVQGPTTILAQLQQAAASLVQAPLDKRQQQHASTPMLSTQQYIDLISFAATVGEQLAGTGDTSSAQQAPTAQGTVLAGVQDNRTPHEAAADSVTSSNSQVITTSPAAEPETLRSRSAGRRLMSDFGASLLGPVGASLDTEALLSDDANGLTSFRAALVPVSTEQTALQPRAAGTGRTGGAGGSGGLNSLSNNCFLLPVELCIAIRRANLNVATYAYPYVLGYLAVAMISLWQTLIAATAAGSLVIDAQLLLTLGQQFSLVVALLGGLGVVVSVDQLDRILPM